MSAHPADVHDMIVVRGAREHNLRGVDVELPKRRLTAFTGVSGSGKSSLVFATIAAESQRLINETYSAFLQGFMPSQTRPDVDVLAGLSTDITVSQERLGSNPRSTVGTATDVNPLLRILFARLGSPRLDEPNAFSFNIASVSGAGAVTLNKGGRQVKERRSFEVLGGMCPRCEGRGQVSDFDLEELYDDSLSLNDGALKVPGYSMDGWYGRVFSGVLPMDKPIRDFTKKQLDDLLYKEPTKIKVEGTNLTYEGLIPRIRKSMLAKDREAMQPHIRRFVDRAIVFQTCPECHGTRLGERARSVTIGEGNGQKNIAEVCALQISDLLDWVRGLRVEGAGAEDAGFGDAGPAPLIARLADILESCVRIGLGYLSLDRATGTLSGGESQRIKMIKHLGSPLTDVTYIFDEPSIGLHPHDIERMNTLLLKLRDKGNTVLVVEHKPEMIRIADHVVDLGPGAGGAGGRICYEGTVEGLRASGTLTGRHLDDRARTKEEPRARTGSIEVRDAVLHNLDHVDVDIPLGVLCAITGVAGSGKSSLIHGYVAGRPGVVTVDQTAIKGSRRSNPATYTGLLDPVRKAFAKANGVKASLFSANSDGACPECKGAGVVFTELGVMATVESVCQMCQGRRYDAEVLVHTLDGKSIADVLDMSVAEAQAFFSGSGAKVPAAVKILARLADVGLGYLHLGQPLSTLSGGERQRLKLAIHMGEEAEVYVLDEPTTGLHLADVEALLGLLDRLVDQGKSVIVIEHHQAVMAHADWIVDLGPGAGTEGGRVVFEGTPAELVETGRTNSGQATLTGRHLAEYVA
ncbi:excinuclease ABC subunit UvrA [Brevibacterium sp. 50QC2O2]|uniref:excinuclease ABC subunit UvrA n=1 Tax=Brevibacterium sp. 50QC2O2 TaxID=2968459 RepID=UPI00211BA7AA|nr:excinuclease ABC subunit UvrA [Brevibacterium sp. 50QC2O2]MCQ9388261.1 excinuclease ABC subunit UvrA [Brevibacterium sp. 50QC2O2]